jgi:hypothetical protein
MFVIRRTVPSAIRLSTPEWSFSDYLKCGMVDMLRRKKGENTGARWKFGMSVVRIQRCQVAGSKHYMQLFNAPSGECFVTQSLQCTNINIIHNIIHKPPDANDYNSIQFNLFMCIT